jgi:hypothetical protein
MTGETYAIVGAETGAIMKSDLASAPEADGWIDGFYTGRDRGRRKGRSSPRPATYHTASQERKASMSIPYAGAEAGTKARNEISKVLRHFGCESIGFMDDYEKHEVLLAFTHRGRNVQLRASAKGWAAIWLKAHPYSSRCRRSRVEYEQDALKQGHVAVNSILRDWIKGQVTAVECGILSFEAVFAPFMLTADGRPLLERVGELLPKADKSKVVALPGAGIGTAP